MPSITCPRCHSASIIKSGIVKARQRYSCKTCRYHFTVLKQGKLTDPYYVTKALQLHLEGISLREIERLLGVSHVSVRNWIKKHLTHSPPAGAYRPSYKVLSMDEVAQYFQQPNHLQNKGCMLTELGDKFMLITWERFPKTTR